MYKRQICIQSKTLHTADYKRCEGYQNLQGRKNPVSKTIPKRTPSIFRTMNVEQNMNTRDISFPTYAQIAGLQRHSESSPPHDSNANQTANEDITLSHFLTKFETMFSLSLIHI